jgi:predicted nucleic acid-binding protein
MDTYTVDASAVLVYLVDTLPPAADDIFSRAEAGEAVLELPAMAAVETLYRAAKGVTVRGATLSVDPADLRAGFDTFLPVTVVDDRDSLLDAVVPLMDPFPNQMHDAMILASHRDRDTDAVVTADEKWTDHAEAIWA